MLVSSSLKTARQLGSMPTIGVPPRRRNSATDGRVEFDADKEGGARDVEVREHDNHRGECHDDRTAVGDVRPISPAASPCRCWSVICSRAEDHEIEAIVKALYEHGTTARREFATLAGAAAGVPAGSRRAGATLEQKRARRVSRS